MKSKNLCTGPIGKTMILFAIPMVLGNLLQQFYNIADTFIVGRFLGAIPLAAVGSSFSLMTFLTSIILGLCMGSGALFSMYFGKEDIEGLKRRFFVAFVCIGVFSLILNLVVYLFLDDILVFLNVPLDTYADMHTYLWWIFLGIFATFLYNFFSCYLRSLGNSVVPLMFLGVSSLLNIGLDLYFILNLKMGVSGAAIATIISQYVSGIGISIYTFCRMRHLLPKKEDCQFSFVLVREIGQYSILTSLQQSIMNFGILLVQGLVNSFGTIVMAAFSAAVKIDAFAYMPVQDFGNAFSTFIAQNYGAGKHERISKGMKQAFLISGLFSCVVSLIVFIFAGQLMSIFISSSEADIIKVGVSYLRIEGAFYIGIGFLFLFYGLYRAIEKPMMSVILTIVSLGTRVILAYQLSSIMGVNGIWISVPIGWFLADLVGFIYYLRLKKQ